MKKLALLLFFVMTAFCALGAAEVFFIPGWYSEWIIYSKHTRTLETLFPQSKVNVCKWDSNRLWKNAKISAGEFAREFSSGLLTQKNTENVILIGHSLGGRIVLDTAAELAKQKRKVRRLILLGTAGRMSEADVKNCQQISILPVVNIYCPDDNLLKLYLHKEKHPPLGYAGLPEKIPHFQQYRMKVPDNDIKVGKVTVIKAETAEFFRETSAHLAKKYLQILAMALAGEIGEDYPSETP